MSEDRIIRDTLFLVMENPPSLEIISTWSFDEKQLAGKWAIKVHLSASDNSIRKKNLETPKFLRTFCDS